MKNKYKRLEREIAKTVRLIEQSTKRGKINWIMSQDPETAKVIKNALSK